MPIPIPHPEFIGLGACAALKLALKSGLHLQFNATEYCPVPGRVYVLMSEGLVQEAFELKPVKTHA